MKISDETAIPKAVKERVWERDNKTCIICHNRGNPWAHYISRQRLGKGIEENIVTLCNSCHYKFDYGTPAEKEVFGQIIKEYLISKYPEWDEEKLILKKGE